MVWHKGKKISMEEIVKLPSFLSYFLINHKYGIIGGGRINAPKLLEAVNQSNIPQKDIEIIPFCMTYLNYCHILPKKYKGASDPLRLKIDE